MSKDDFYVKLLHLNYINLQDNFNFTRLADRSNVENLGFLTNLTNTIYFLHTSCSHNFQCTFSLHLLTCAVSYQNFSRKQYSQFPNYPAYVHHKLWIRLFTLTCIHQLICVYRVHCRYYYIRFQSYSSSGLSCALIK